MRFDEGVSSLGRWSIIRTEKTLTMNFKLFKKQLSKLITTTDGFDSECYQDWYVGFKEGSYRDVNEFAEFWFADITLDTHDYALRSK